MEKKSYEIKITITDLLRIFIWRLWIIAIVAILAGGATLAYSIYTYTPVYKSTSQIYILRQNTENETSQSYAQNLNAALTIVNDCKKIIKTDTTMIKVKETTGLKMSTSQLLSSVTLSSTDNSRIVTITAKHTNPETAKIIADAVAEHGVERISQVMGYDQASVMETGKVPSSPANSKYSSKIIVIAGIAGLLVYAFYLILFLSNDKIRDPEEVTDYLGLTVLGIIPNEEIISGKKKSKGYNYYYKYKKHSKYGQYGQYGSYGNQNDTTETTQNNSSENTK